MHRRPIRRSTVAVPRSMSHLGPATLRRAVGSENFYAAVANMDTANMAGWLEMVNVQADFAAGEASYDPEARTYSESMRETLHWSLVYVFEDRADLPQVRRSSGGIFGWFIRLHPTAFKANGACSMSPMGMAAVTFNTRGSMITARNIAWLTQGMTQQYGAAIRAANTVRDARRRAGKRTTTNGYEGRTTLTNLERRLADQARRRSISGAAYR